MHNSRHIKQQLATLSSANEQSSALQRFHGTETWAESSPSKPRKHSQYSRSPLHQQMTTLTYHKRTKPHQEILKKTVDFVTHYVPLHSQTVNIYQNTVIIFFSLVKLLTCCLMKTLIKPQLCYNIHLISLCTSILVINSRINISVQ